MSTHRLAAFVLLLPFGVVSGCSDRQIEPDYSDIIRDACEAACPITTECIADPYYASTEECIEMCSSGYGEKDLNQCDSRSLENDFCTGSLTCEEYQEYDMSVGDSDPSIDPNFKCAAELEAFYACDPTQPFEEPDR
jgi:hypothetical protein